jgi:hypothetical protein
MESCDKCGKRVDERSMAPVESEATGKVYYICLACRGYYDDVELLDLLEPDADHNLN